MRKIDLSQVQENAPRGWYVRKVKDVIEANKIISGKNLRLWMKMLPGNKLEFIDGIPKYLKVDTQAQLCGTKRQYIPTHNCKNLESTQDFFNRTGLIDHLLEKDWLRINPTYKGGKDKEEREELLDEVINKGL